jgi:hypothetical protein
MFQWDQNRTSLHLYPSRVLHLERSLSDVQVTLPGGPPENAGAYLCAFTVQGGIRVTVVLHLRKSGRLGFYLNTEGEVNPKQATRVIEEGHQFAESLGFILGDLDFERLAPKQKQELWDSMPFGNGAREAAPQRTPAPAPPARPVPAPPARPAAAPPPPVAPSSSAAHGAKSSRRTPERPAAEEVQNLRQTFTDTLGRLLAML